MSAIKALMTGLIDYAGLFPPASLDMETAVRNYRSYLHGEHAWMLGHFVLPANRLREFSDAFRYYKDARLLQLRRTDTRLLIVLQIGASVRDVKVFRFAIDAQNCVSYMDARGEEDGSADRTIRSAPARQGLPLESGTCSVPLHAASCGVAACIT